MCIRDRLSASPARRLDTPTMPIPVASTRRSPKRLTNLPAPGADAKRTSANTEMTAPAAKLLTPKSLANSGMAGARIPKPRATENATAVRTATSGGRDPKGLRRARIRGPILAGPGNHGYQAISTAATRCSPAVHRGCLLYTSDAADDLTRVDLDGRRTTT